MEERGTTKKLRSREGDWAKGLGYSLPSWSTGGCTKQLVKESKGLWLPLSSWCRLLWAKSVPSSTMQSSEEMVRERGGGGGRGQHTSPGAGAATLTNAL